MTVSRPDLNGMLLQKPGRAAQYLVDQGLARPFNSLELRHKILRYDSTVTPMNDLDEITPGPFWPDNVLLIRPQNRNETYLIDGQAKRPIRSGQLFASYQFKSPSVEILEDLFQ